MRMSKMKKQQQLPKRCGNPKTIISGGPFPPILYGLDGVMSVFDVSKPTASRYVNGLIRESVCRKGRVLLIDTRKALECFGIPHPERFIAK